MYTSYPLERYWCECGAELIEGVNDSTSARSGRFVCDVCGRIYYILYPIGAYEQARLILYGYNIRQSAFDNAGGA